MRKYYALIFVILFVATCIYLLSRDWISGKYSCSLFDYLDGSNNTIVFGNGGFNQVTRSYTGSISVTKLGTYEKVSYGCYRIIFTNGPFDKKDSVMLVYSGLFGLSLTSDKFADMGLQKSFVGPVLFLRQSL